MEKDVDIYVTGSNARLLSSEYATLLSGRYVQFTVYPFSFMEYCLARRSTGREMGDKDFFRDYLIEGGMPFLAQSNLDQESKMQYLLDIYASVVINDIVKRCKVRDVDLLDRVLAYAIDNIGHPFSATRIAKCLKNEKRKATVDRIINYLNACQRALLFYKIPRSDLVGKEMLSINEKYYLADHGIRQALFCDNERQIETTLENIVLMEILRHGYQVSVGKIGEREIDFVCTRRDRKFYVQVSYLLFSQETIQREFTALESIPDNYPKYVLSLDEVDLGRNGILHRNIRDFLLHFPE